MECQAQQWGGLSSVSSHSFFNDYKKPHEQPKEIKRRRIFSSRKLLGYDAPSFLIVSLLIGGLGFFINAYLSKELEWLAVLLQMKGGILFLYACITFGKKDRQNILD